jgi:transcriptional repressor NrdR
MAPIEKLTCPFCKCRLSRVTQPRAHPDGRSIHRRRECLSCHRRYPTIEVIPRPLKKNRNI